MKRLILVVSMVASCRPTASETPAPTNAQPPPSTEPGPVLEASIPLLSGDAVALGSFRGKVVVLELSASYRDSWEVAHRHYRGLLDTHGEDALAVVTVSMDMEADAIGRYWEQDPPPFVLGWDPQGALAARLGVQRLPAIFVLDRQGRLLLERGGFDEAVAQEIAGAVRRAVRSASGTQPRTEQ
jgi:hypothetical protein